jgi:ribosomal protein L11 methyltransferase
MTGPGGGWQVSFDLTDRTHLDAFDDALETLDGAITAREIDGGPCWRILCHCAVEPDRAALAGLIAAAARAVGLPPPEIAVEPLPETDWVAEYQRNTKPMTIGRFHVYPSHHAADIPPAMMPIRMDAGRAFGTGSHESTSGCLLALDRIQAAGASPLRALDMGCGSGILAIAMALLWPAAAVTACDNDADAVEVAVENTVLNGVAARIACFAGDGFNAPEVAAAAPYDAIAANILAGPLTDMAPALAAVLAPGGVAVLSGILTVQADGVVVAYAAAGLDRAERIALGEWTTLVLRESAAA